MLKIQLHILKIQPQERFRTLKFKNFFAKVFRANFCQRFLVSESYFHAEFESAERI